MGCRSPSRTSLDNVVDHRDLQTPVREQGERPACVGFAVSAAHEWMAETNDLASPEDALWAAHQEGGPPDQEATRVELALAGLDSHGHAMEEAWPFGSPAWPASRPDAAMDSNARRVLPHWRSLGKASPGDVALRIEAEQAVILSLHVVRSAWRDPAGRVDAAPGRRRVGGHAVLAVGIEHDIQDASSLIIKNSWGKGWGAGGYGFVSARYLANYMKQAFVLERP